VRLGVRTEPQAVGVGSLLHAPQVALAHLVVDDGERRDVLLGRGDQAGVVAQNLSIVGANGLALT